VNPQQWDLSFVKPRVLLGQKKDTMGQMEHFLVPLPQYSALGGS
jgi:hypothetical protein